MAILRPDRWFCLTLCLLFAGCSADPIKFQPQRHDLPQGRVDVSFQVEGQIPVVTAETPGGAALMALSTGVDFHLVSLAASQRLQLPVRHDEFATRDGIDGVSQASGVAMVDPVSVGNASFRHVPIAIMEQPHATPADIDGTFGSSLFADLLVTIDWRNQRLTFEEGQLPRPNDHDIFPIRRTPDGAMLIPLKIDNRIVWARFDTAAPVGIAIPADDQWRFPPPATASEPPVHNPGETYQMARNVRLGRHVLYKPNVLIGDVDRPTIGALYLRHFTITIDRTNARVRLSRPLGAPLKLAAR